MAGNLAGILEEYAAGPAVAVSVHPDPRSAGAAGADPRTGAGTGRGPAAARARARGPAGYGLPADQLPLNLEVSELVTWNALMRDRRRRPAIAGLACG